MKLERLTYEPGTLLDFYEAALTSLGALCERTWHDRLEIVAEGVAATLWDRGGGLHSGELHFVDPDVTAARDAKCEVFPGCPLTFALAEAQRPSPLPLERVVLSHSSPTAPETAVAEKLWRNQFPDTRRWRLVKAFAPSFHFSLLALVRCEIQAIDQHWSLHRIALGLPSGEPDEDLVRDFPFSTVAADLDQPPAWPPAEANRWKTLLQTALENALAPELDHIRARQEISLQRELNRVDDYFENYERELEERGRRSSTPGGKLKTADRLTAAKAEHARRRADQVARHEIRVHPHFDVLVLVAERAWQAELEVQRAHQSESVVALFIPRSRRWQL